MPRIARFVESLAMTLHQRAGFDNQSTTTAAYNPLNGTLYITHQANKRFDDVVGQDVMVRLAFQQQPVAAGLAHTAPPPNWAGGMKKVGTGANRIQAWFAQARAQVALLSKAERFDEFVNEIRWIKVVMNQDLFMVKPPSLSGFHGESRIIRLLYLKDVRGMTDGDLAAMQPRAMAAGVLIEQVTKRFREAYGGRLFMGSSQGACEACAGYMGILGIGFHSVQSRSKDRTDTWVHPITMTTEAHGFGYPVTSGVILTPTAVAQKEVRAGRV